MDIPEQLDETYQEPVQNEGSTSSSDHSSPVLPELPEEPFLRPHISLEDVRGQDDHWTYPQTNASKGTQPSYAPELRVPVDGVTGYLTRGSNSNPNPNLTPRRGKRPRQLQSPDQTADVRKSGACLPCRLSKTRCSENDVCPTCRKAFPHHSHLVCARTTLVELWPVITKGPDVWSRSPEKEFIYSAQGGRTFTGRSKPISVLFSNKPGSPALSAHVQPYRWQGEDEDSQLEKAAFSSDHPVSYEMLRQWVEQELETHSERELDFPLAIHKFLMIYTRDGYGLPKHGLVRKVHYMACFFSIWKIPFFWCQDLSGKTAMLPISIQTHLRRIVYLGIHSMEHDILKELDTLVTPSHQPKPDDKLALWASLWQLIIIYRDLTAESKVWLSRSEQRQEGPLTFAVRSRCHYLFENFFPLITIFYHYQFRTKKSLELSPDWLRKYSARRHVKGIEAAAKDMLDCRKKFMQNLQASEEEIDHLLCIFVVNHEIKKLNARKRAPKAKSQTSRHDGDGDHPGRVNHLTGASADDREVATEGSDSSSEDLSIGHWSAPWSDQAGATELSSLSHGSAVDMEYTAGNQPPMNFYGYSNPVIGKDLVEEDDDVQSINSIPDDIASLAASTSVSPDYRQAAVNYLVKKFTDDSELLSLYQDATRRIGGDRFVRNHRRLLKRYFLDLQSEGYIPSQKLAVRFLRLRSERTLISSKIRRIVMPVDNTVFEKFNIALEQEKGKLSMLDRFLAQKDSTASAGQGIENTATNDVDAASEASEDTDDCGSDANTIDDGTLPKLDATTEFLTTGRAFSLYKENIRAFIHSRASTVEKSHQLDFVETSSSKFMDASRDVDQGELESIIPSPPVADEKQPTVSASGAYHQAFMPRLHTLIHPSSFESKLKTMAKVASEQEVGVDPDGTLREVVSELLFSKPVEISVTDEAQLSWIDKTKELVESSTLTPWDWWPLAPKRNTLRPGHSRLSWICRCGERRTADIPKVYAHYIVEIREQTIDQASEDIAQSQTRHQGNIDLGPESSSAGKTATNFPRPGASTQSSDALASITPGGGSPSIVPMPSSSRYIPLLMPLGSLLLSEIESQDLCNEGLFRKIREEYYRAKGIRRWFTTMKFSHCEFFKFEEWSRQRYCERFPGIPPYDDAAYFYEPRPMDREPPISRHEFHDRFYQKVDSEDCLVGVPHDRCSDRDAVDRIPQKKELVSISGQKRQQFYGIVAREKKSGAKMMLYILVSSVPGIIFFFLWIFQWGHDSLQDATVLLMLSYTLLGLLYAAQFL